MFLMKAGISRKKIIFRKSFFVNYVRASARRSFFYLIKIKNSNERYEVVKA